jgi:hypothetical protein
MMAPKTTFGCLCVGRGMMKLRFGLVLIASGLCLSSLGMGAASANNEFAGRTYGEVAAQLSKAGGSAAISAIVGDQLPTDQCIVTGSRKASNLDSSGRSRGYQILVDLNCEKPLADAGHPGNSISSAPGAEAKKVESWIAAWNKGNLASCLRSADVAQWCLGQCNKYGGCTAETISGLTAAT